MRFWGFDERTSRLSHGVGVDDDDCRYINYFVILHRYIHIQYCYFYQSFRRRLPLITVKSSLRSFLVSS